MWNCVRHSCRTRAANVYLFGLLISVPKGVSHFDGPRPNSLATDEPACRHHSVRTHVNKTSEEPKRFLILYYCLFAVATNLKQRHDCALGNKHLHGLHSDMTS